MKKIFQILKLIFYAKKVWSRPNKVDILIYDNNFSEYFVKKFSNYKCDILFLRGENINIFIIFKLIFSFKFKNLILNYSKLYIETAQPKIIITGTDNNINFYKLKNQVDKLKFKTVVVQNAHRTLTTPDILNYFENFDEKKLLGNVFHITKERLACQMKTWINPDKTIEVEIVNLD